jgi:glycosyltransferase involved in cell wall biosynthesis
VSGGVVSIITPSFNQGRFIERTIQSVIDQDLNGWSIEYIVIDGGSSDQTVEVLRKYPHLRWISEPDGGQADAVNKGLRATSGEIVGWLNSDDVYRPVAIASVCEFFEKHPEVDVVFGEADYLDEIDNLIGRYPTHNFLLSRLEEDCFLCQPAVFFRRRVVDRFGELDARLHYALDYEYWLRLARGGASFAYMPEILAGSRLYPATKTRAGRMDSHLEVNSMLRRRLGHVPDRWIYNYAHARLERTRIDRGQHLRFALALAALSVWASLRWNHALPATVRHTTAIWIRDGIKSLAFSLKSQARAALR